MSTQLSNLVYDLEHNALLAKQFMYSHESLVANYGIPSEDRFYKSSYFNKIYDKAFTFNYTNLSEFLAELKSTVRHYTSE